MKKRGRLRKGLAVLLTATMVVGLMPGAGTIKVSAAEGEASGSVATAEGYDENGFCTSFELTNGTWALKSGETCNHDNCNGYQPAVEELLDYDINGDGTTDANDKAYKITNAGQLYWFADKVNNDYENYKDKNAVLTKDITVNEGVLSDGALNTANESTFRSWTPIGYYADSTLYPYNGIFDGAGHTITELYVNADSTDRVGLFGINSGTIKNVGIVNSYFGGTNMVGSVCGYNYTTNGIIENCYNIDSIISGSMFIGGVSGFNEGTITSCENTGNVLGSDCVGGVCGGIDGLVKNCSNRGNVKASNSGAFGGVGGVCGYFSSGSLGNSYNIGEVDGKSNIGGICGDFYTSNPSIKNCYYKTKEDNSLAAIGSDGGGYKIYVEGKTFEQFSNGMVAYLLNSRSGEDSPVWYQNIDNGATPDTAPVLDSSHGIVYASKPCPVKCSNTESTALAESQAHSFGDDNICTVCGAKGEIIDDPALKNHKPEQDAAGVYQITTNEELYYFVALVNGRLVGVAQDTSASAVLKTDITVNDNVLDENGNLVSETVNLKTWVPIGYSDGVSVQTYTGTFDGGGHTISGLYFADSSISYVGLFGSSTGTIKNIKVADSYFKGDTYVGGICGKNEGNIEGCEVSGKVEANNKYADFGGICGYNGTGYVKNCKSTVDISYPIHNTDPNGGGIVGQNDGTIENCHNIGEVYLRNTNEGTAGGICGKNNTSGTIKNSYNVSSVTGNYFMGYTGGICGENYGSIANCYSTGDVIGDYKGKVCGNKSSGVTNCYYQDSSESDSIAGTTFKEATQFASGEVAYLLNEGKTDNDVVWRQTLNTDTAPVLDSTHSIVYASKPCESEFANTEFTEEKKHTVTMSEDGTSHTCSVCKKTEQHADVATFTVDDEKHSITATCPSGCELGTITLSASDATYDGADKAASISGEIKGFDTPSIVYEKKGTDGSVATIDSTPKDAGTYRASITYTVDEAKNKVYSVSVTYDISPATPTLTWESEKTVGYTGDAITEEKIGAPTVTLVNGESYKGAIQYSYRTKDSSDEFTSGLPTEIGTYEVKAVVDADGNYAKAEKSMTLTIAWLTGVADATLKDQGGKSLTGDDWWAQSVTFTSPEGYTIYGTVDGTYGDSYTYDTETAEAGTEVTYYLKNSAGEIAQKSATVRVDTTAPDWSGANDGISIKTNKWKSLLSTISFGLFYKETVDVTVSASDSLSGVAKYYYYVDTSAGETVKTKEELDALANGESGFTEYAVTNANAAQKITSLSADSSCVVYVYAVDKAGNKSDYICSNGVVIDKTAPTISDISTPSEGSGEDATLTDTKADMTFTASESGTYFYIVKKSSEGALTAIADFADSSVDENTGMTVWTANEGVTADAMTAGDSNRLSLTGLTANTEYTVYVVAVDKAGNISNILSQTFTTCKTMPKVTTNPTLSGTYGTAVSAMTLENGVAKAGDTVIDGTWTLTDANASDVSSVGTTNTYEVTFTPADTYNGQYETVKVSVKPTVERKAVTVTAENKSKTYGQENPKLTFTVPEGSLVGSDTEEALGVTLSCEATKTSPVQEGGYAITGTSSSANYEVTVTPGILTINQASAEITVGTESYSKTFGNAAFNLGVTDSNTDEGADVTYAVSDSKNAEDTSVADDKVITVDASGKVTIVGAGSATITASLAESNNFKAATSKTITVTVAKETGYTVSDIQESYLYSKDTEESIDLSKYIPDDCGTVAYGIPQTTDDLFTSEGAPAITDSKLTYTVKQAATYGATGTIKVTVSSDNYADFVITVSLKLIDKIPVKLQSGSSVSLVSNTLTYGEALLTLTFNKAIFVDGDGTEVTGTLDWTDKTMKPAVAVTSSAWKFTPENSDYATVEGNLTIKVEKAEPNVKVLPTVADRIYHPNAKLADTDLILTEATVLDVNGQELSGTWNWKTAGVIPTVNNSGYEAVFTPADTDNYNTISKTITVNVAKATPYIKDAPTVAAITYGKTLADATITGGSVQYSSTDDTAVEGRFAWKADTTKPAVADSDTTAYKVVFTPTNENYNTVETEITVTVNKAASAPGLPNNTMEVDYSKEKVSDITLPEGWAWQDAYKEKTLTVGTAVAATAVYTGADKGNYVTESVEISITRLKCTHATTEVKGAKAATCTGKGYTGDTYCKDCGVKLADGTEIAMTDHKWDAGKVTKEPTETAEGVKTYTCSVCGKTKTEAIPKKEAATPQPPKKGDVVKDDKTSVKVEVSDVKKKEVEYKEPVNKKAKTVSIPATVKINGVTYKVTKIADNAFKNNKTVTKVTVGSNIKTIGKNAFYKCTKLKTVKIGKNVTTIGSNAFKGCTSLTSVTLPSKATKIGANAFSGCKKLKTIKITSTKLTSKTVAKNAFKGLTKATTIKVPKKKLSAYKKLFKQKGLSSKVKVKGY